MKNSIFSGCCILACIIFAIGGCQSLKNTTLHPKQKNANLLPSLTPALNANNFINALELYDTDFKSGNVVYATNTSFNLQTVEGQIMHLAEIKDFNNPVINDIYSIFSRDVSLNICDFNTNVKGAIVCHAVDGSANQGLYFLIPPSLFLTPLVFMGYPIAVPNIKLQIEVFIYDINYKLVGRYISKLYKSHSWVAPYWGYSFDNAIRYNARIAFTKCMNDIKLQIMNDYARLYPILENAIPASKNSDPTPASPTIIINNNNNNSNNNDVKQDNNNNNQK